MIEKGFSSSFGELEKMISRDKQLIMNELPQVAMTPMTNGE
jgi:hypothetical protein